ncbi:MAG: peptidylprolyl isomerase [Planctomycetes bacterium]|nr:peptidylprolyl isomerase [Planctomycetota bacterium]
MKHFGLIAIALCLVALASCNDPAPKKKPDADRDVRPAVNESHPADSKDNPIVAMETSMGTVKMALFKEKAPISVANFLRYVDDRHYDGTTFHRVKPRFMIQGGGVLPGMREKTELLLQGIKNEADNGLSNERGTLAMARTNDPHSATAQFYINTVANRALDRDKAQDGFGYAVFGRVTEGMEVVDKIESVRTGPRAGHQDVPTDDVLIKSIRRVESK